MLQVMPRVQASRVRARRAEAGSEVGCQLGRQCCRGTRAYRIIVCCCIRTQGCEVPHEHNTHACRVARNGSFGLPVSLPQQQ